MILALLLSLALPSRAATCVETRPVIIAGTQGYVMAMGDKCLVSIDPSLSLDLVYRSYAVFDDGLLMVFNSFGDGEDIGRLTAAREFYFFPRSGPVSLAMVEGGTSVTAVMSNGDALSFDPATAQISGARRGTVVVAPSIDPANRGGVEFPSYAGLMLDLGFARGHSPANGRESDSIFRDAAGQTCSVKNRELFDYVGGEHLFKFTDAALVNWLRFRCPFLDPGFAPAPDPIHTQARSARSAPFALQLKQRSR
jgi:hypothetical protein